MRTESSDECGVLNPTTTTQTAMDPADCMLQQSPKMLTIRKDRQTTFIFSLDSHQLPEW